MKKRYQVSTKMGQNIKQDQYTMTICKHFKHTAEPVTNIERKLNLKDLCLKIREVFLSTNPDLDLVYHLLLTYKSNPADWEAYINFDDKIYTRNLIDDGNGKYNLIVLCWNTEQQSSIHDHSDCNCFMKILQGELNEVQYKMESECGRNNKLVEVAHKTIKTNDVGYISDNIGLHQIKNPSKTIGAISLHLYYPAFQFCKVFDKDGASKVSEMKFHTKFDQINQ